MKGTIYFLATFMTTLLSSSKIAGIGVNHEAPCCMFKQWEGVTVSVEREFDPLQGGVFEKVTTEKHFYDFNNGRVATLNLDSGRFSIKDYREGIGAFSKDKMCFKVPIKDSMTRSCLPSDSVFLGKHFLGLDIPVTLWSSSNDTSHLVVLQKTCIPISEETFQTNGPHSLATMTYFYNVTFGIKNDDIFSIPDTCVHPDVFNEMDPHEINEYFSPKKRSFPF